MRRFKRLLPLGVIALLLAGAAWGQSDLSDLIEQSQNTSLFSDETKTLPLETPEAAMFALDEPIDPDEYQLGPGDVLGISIPRAVGSYIQIMIGPDGSLAVPNLPVVQVAGMTINEARSFLTKSWSRSGKGVQIAIMQMRRMRVSVGGEVTLPGQYIVSPVDRASILVELAFGARRTAHPRKATLVRRDGSRMNVDLLRFRNSGNTEANPRLQAGDHLVVHPKRLYDPEISVGGAVIKPGNFPWIEGDDVRSAIDLAGGLNVEMLGDSIFVSRIGSDGRIESHAMASTAMEQEGEKGIALQPGDAVRVQAKQYDRTRSSVVVSGEVMKPGAYPIVPGKTTLSEIIREAGGFTEYAWLKGARIWKPWENTDPRKTYAQALDSLTNIKQRYIDEETIRHFHRDAGRDYVSVNFEKVFGGPGSVDKSADVVLYENLQITVPREIHTVLVSGQVIKPGILPYQEGWNYKDYVKAVGGFAKSAQKRRARLIPYESNVWYTVKSSTEIQPGDIIFVPEVDEKASQDAFSSFAYLVVQSGTLLTLIIRTFFLN